MGIAQPSEEGSPCTRQHPGEPCRRAEWSRPVTHGHTLRGSACVRDLQDMLTVSVTKARSRAPCEWAAKVRIVPWTPGAVFPTEPPGRANLLCWGSLRKCWRSALQLKGGSVSPHSFYDCCLLSFHKPSFLEKVLHKRNDRCVRSSVAVVQNAGFPLNRKCHVDSSHRGWRCYFEQCALNVV